jgi:hypothetical protein
MPSGITPDGDVFAERLETLHWLGARCYSQYGIPSARFWYAAGGYLYDVVDGPDGDDASLRPNQLRGVALN